MSGTAVASSGLISKHNYTLRLAEVLGWTGTNGEGGALEFLRLQTARELIMAQERLITEKVFYRSVSGGFYILCFVGTSTINTVSIRPNH